MITRGIFVAAALAAGVALGAPAPAHATHYQCEGFNDPSCNVQYFSDHNVRPVQQEIAEIRREVEGTVLQPVVDLVVGDCPDVDCVAARWADLVNDTYRPIQRTVYDIRDEAVDTAMDAAYPVLCGTFGAC